MKNASLQILRVGTAVTFLWIGVLILREPEAWGGLIQSRMAVFLPFSLKFLMTGTAVLDILVGFLLLINRFTWQAALLGSFHLLAVLAVSGINAITVRDLGLLSGTIAIFASSFSKVAKPIIKNNNN